MDRRLGRTALLEAQQPAHDRRRAGLGLRIDPERHFAVADARLIYRTAGKNDVALGEIVETGRRDGVVDLELVAFAPTIGALDTQGAVLAGQDLGELDHRRARIEHRRDFRTLKPECAGRAGARLLGGEPHLAAVARHLGPDDLAALDVAALRAHDHSAAGDG